jgi:hypothetical protein
MTSDDDRPTCPICKAPFRDIELAHVESQKSMAAMNSSQFKHRMVLFCGHKVEMTIDRSSVNIRVDS